MFMIFLYNLIFFIMYIIIISFIFVKDLIFQDSLLNFIVSLLRQFRLFLSCNWTSDRRVLVKRRMSVV